MLLKEFISASEASLGTLYPEGEARSIVSLLVTEILGVDKYAHLIDPSFTIDPSKVPDLESSLRRLMAWEPVQYVLGYEEFMGRRFKVNPSTLIPRPETEVLCREVLSRLSSSESPRILDLCTGSGCIAWTLSLSLPGSDVVGVDISEKALEVARSQFSEGNAPSFFEGDIFEEPNGYGREKFDIIVSNPPYILPGERVRMRRNVLDYEPSLALFTSEEDPLAAYRAISLWAKELLTVEGFGIVEINEGLSEETAEVFLSSGFEKVSILPDFFEKLRFVFFSKRP